MARRRFREWIRGLLRRETVAERPRGDDDTPDRERLDAWLLWSPAIGLVTVVAYAVAAKSADVSFLSILALGLIVGAAVSGVGGLVGFLFGLPRTHEPALTQRGMATNTNLEEISDWLTKILVGLGLIQLGAFVKRLGELSDSLAPGLGGRPGADAFALALIVYCLIDGFLLGYLWTRVVVSPLLKKAQSRMAQEIAITSAVLEQPLPSPPPLGSPPRPPGVPPTAPSTARPEGPDADDDG